MTPAQSHLALRPFADGDIDMLTTWLNQDYILRWYHNPEDWLFEINQRHVTFAWIHHFIVMHENAPIGFCQYYDCYEANDMEDWYDVPRRNDTFSIDYLIGNAIYLGKGFGKAIVALLTETIRQNEHARQIIVQPAIDNYASNHVLMANGYVYDGEKAYYCKALTSP